MASPAELELELGRERRDAAKAARKARNLPIGRPGALSPDQTALAERMRVAGEPVPEIAKPLGVSRPAVYRPHSFGEQGVLGDIGHCQWSSGAGSGWFAVRRARA